MKPTLRLFSIGLSVLIVAASARAQFSPQADGAFPSRMPATVGGSPNDYTSPLRQVDGMQGMPPTSPGLINPMPAENLGRTACKPEGPWIGIAPYTWAVGMKGTIANGPISTRVDLTPGDAIGDYFNDLRGALGLHLEAGVGDVGLIADLMYLSVRPQDQILRVEERATILELLGFYRLLDTGRCPGGCTFDVLAGARYYHFRNAFSIQPIDLMLPNKTEDWWDLVVGVRGSVMLTESLSLFARADYGGFDIGESSKQACNVILGFNWQCTDCISIMGGYRWFKIDRENGDGFDRFKLNVTMSGPFVALGLQF